MLDVTCKELSEISVEYCFGDTVDTTTNSTVLAVYNHLLESVKVVALEITDIVPTYTTITIYFTCNSPLYTHPNYLDDIINATDITLTCKDTQTFEIEVDYSGEDMDYICKTLSLSKKECIELHANKPYSIAMLGFRPYFPYLLGLDKKLTLARRENPRLHVKKGSVAIGSNQTGIYPEDSPGGWHIIGYTEFDNFEKLRPSDIVIFREVKDLDVD